MRLLIRIGAALLLILFIVILGGLSIQGVVTLWRGFIISDRIYGAAFFLIGIVFGAIATKSLIPYFSKKAVELLSRRLKSNTLELSLATLLTIVLIVIQKKFFAYAIFGGYILGGFIVQQARLGILQIFPIDILDFYGAQLAWLGQWYLFYVIIAWITAYVRKVRNRI